MKVKKKDEDEVTIARSIFDEIVEETESEEKPKFKFPIVANRSLDSDPKPARRPPVIRHEED